MGCGVIFNIFAVSGSFFPISGSGPFSILLPFCLTSSFCPKFSASLVVQRTPILSIIFSARFYSVLGLPQKGPRMTLLKLTLVAKFLSYPTVVDKISLAFESLILLQKEDEF